MNRSIVELDVPVTWRTNSIDAQHAIPNSSTECIGALGCVRGARVHDLPVVEADIKANSAYLTVSDGTIYHGIPDDATATQIAANDNPNYVPRPGTFRVLPPSPSQTLDANRARVHKSNERKRAGLPPVAQGRTGARPHTGRTLNMRPRGAAKITRVGK